MSGDCPTGSGAKRDERGSKADGSRVGTAVRPDLEAALQWTRPRLAMASCQFLFHFEPCLTLLYSSSYTSDLFKFPLRSLLLFSLPCAESPLPSLRGNLTSLIIATLTTSLSQLRPTVHPTRASRGENPLVDFSPPSPGLLSQQNVRRGPQSLLIPHRHPRLAQSRFAHQRMTVLVTWRLTMGDLRQAGEPGSHG